MNDEYIRNALRMNDEYIPNDIVQRMIQDLTLRIGPHTLEDFLETHVIRIEHVTQYRTEISFERTEE